MQNLSVPQILALSTRRPPGLRALLTALPSSLVRPRPVGLGHETTYGHAWWGLKRFGTIVVLS